MIDPAKLSTFFASPDAATIVSAFAEMPQGPLRDSVVSHLVLLSGVAPGAVQAAPEAPEAPQQEAPGPLAPEQPEQPFISASLDGRIVERRMRNETIRQIANNENVEANHVVAVLKEARRNGVHVGNLSYKPIRVVAKDASVSDAVKHDVVKPDAAKPKLSKKLDSRSQKPRVYTKEPRPNLPPELSAEIKAESVRLRLLGYGPGAISRHLGIDRATVSNAVYYAKHSQNVTIPELADDLPALPDAVWKDRINKAIADAQAQDAPQAPPQAQAA